ncbi:hypothetical protein, partial [Streptomyces clavifer]|uniref:hypothetical protein n=1 Tax=Streptomyces clavifer TaxID=68188 RepID=UPI0036B45081
MPKVNAKFVDTPAHFGGLVVPLKSYWPMWRVGNISEDAVDDQPYSGWLSRSSMVLSRLRENIHGEFDPG